VDEGVLTADLSAIVDSLIAASLLKVERSMA
jgi:hypothetical protein